MIAREQPKLAVWKFASCDGCQLSLLNLDEQLLEVLGVVRLAYFPEATSKVLAGPYDISVVEGSVTTAHDAERVREIRESSRFLVAVGACATAGGIQSLRNYADAGDYVRAVYANPQYISTLATSTPISDHVRVDFELRGCPIDQGQILEVLTAHLAGRTPRIPTYALCQECKALGNVCVLVANGTPCLGPVTQAGCGARCPAVGRGCYGCFGPAATANTRSLAATLHAGGAGDAEITRLFRSFTAGASKFASEGVLHDPRL